jgi:ABC-type proline/glycine betaine transport system permease subunit
MDVILERFAAGSDVGHIGLLFWALAVSALLSRTLNELAAANRRFDEFVRELARFNQRHRDLEP